MNGSKDNPGGGGGRRGATNGLRGGKTKQVARGCNDRGIKSSEPDPSRGAHDKPTVWRHGKYVIVRPPKGPGLASRRAGTSSHSRVYGGDQGTSLARPLDMSKTLRDMSKDIIEDDNDDFNEDFEDGDNSDDGENNGGDAGDEDGRDLIDLQGKRIMAHNEGGGGRGRGGGPSSRRETTAHSSTRGGRGRDGGRGSNQVNGHGSTDYREQPTTKAYQLLHEPSDDEDEPIAIGRGAVVPPPIPTPENRIWIWVENDDTGSWQDKSSQNSKNREKVTGGRHTVGSKSFITVRKEMDHTFKRRVKFGEFWLQTHAKKGSRPLDKLPVCSELADVDLVEVDDVEDINQEKNVDWVDTRAGEAYKYGDDISLHPEFDMELWLSVAGGTKKRRLYGTSNITDPYVVLTGAPAKPNTDFFPSARSATIGGKNTELEREKVAELERGKVEKQAMLEKIEENARLLAKMNEKL
ncbi:uncharacterized protein LOC143618846 [Bidens hawaiensis]|uniref:uncharacterized protein LOC143618846 n=1 Tax=Bidens hawaiensis TaxID=980011 RepID=UPI004049F814